MGAGVSLKCAIFAVTWALHVGSELPRIPFFPRTTLHTVGGNRPRYSKKGEYGKTEEAKEGGKNVSVP
jgi:hypothetical protein